MTDAVNGAAGADREDPTEPRPRRLGDSFGEIGSLRDVPRTATIIAVEDTTLRALEREDFLAAVTGQRESRLAADEVITRRLTV